VFSRGIWVGLKGSMKNGGHKEPKLLVGDKLEWKKAQKNEIKKSTSDKINSSMPPLSPFITILEWKPSKVLSRTTSRHHRKEESRVLDRAINSNWLVFVVSIMMILAVKFKALIELIKGQGLTLTMWKG